MQKIKRIAGSVFPKSLTISLRVGGGGRVQSGFSSVLVNTNSERHSEPQQRGACTAGHCVNSGLHAEDRGQDSLAFPVGEGSLGGEPSCTEWTAHPQGSRHEPTHLDELVHDNVETVFLHVQRLGMVGRLKDL